MAQHAALLESFPGRHPRHVLATLAGSRRPDGARALVRLLLTAGHVVTGYVVRVDADRHDGDQLVLGHESSHDTVLFLPVSAVVAVEIFDPAALAPNLSGGQVARAPSAVANAPTPLALRRKLVEHAAAFAPAAVEVAWDGVPADDGARLNLADLLVALEAAVASAQADDLGRAAWAKVSAVVLAHRVEQALAIERDGGRLTVAVDLTRALPATLTEAATKALLGVL
jgi:hypothetical protein